MPERKRVQLPKQPKGLTCDRCGCGQFDTPKTWRVIRAVRRRHRCRACGYEWTSTATNDAFPPSESNGSDNG